MADRGPRKPKSDDPAGKGPALPNPSSTLSDESDAPFEPPTIGPRLGKTPDAELSTDPEAMAPIPRGASKAKLPQVAPRSPSKAALPVVNQTSKAGLPGVNQSSKAGLHGVNQSSKAGLHGVNQSSKAGLPGVKGPSRSSTRVPAVLAQDDEVQTDARLALPPQPERAAVAESPTALRPSLGTTDAPTGPLKAIHELGTAPGVRPAHPSGEIVEITTDKRKSPVAGSLREDPASSTMGYRSLRMREKGVPLLDNQTRLYLAAAVVGTFLVGAVLWKLASPSAPGKDLSAPRALPHSVALAARPIEPEKPQVVAARPTGIFLEETIDAGNGYVRTVKIEAGTVQIFSAPDVTLSRNGIELGKTPITITLPVGSVTLQVANKAEGLSRTQTIEITPGVNEGKRWVFARGRIEVRAPNGTSVTVDGHGVGKTPLAAVAAWPGQHTVDVAFPKGGTERRKVTVEAGSTIATDFEAPVYDSKLAQ